MPGSVDENSRAGKKGPPVGGASIAPIWLTGRERIAVQQRLLMYAKCVAQGREGLFS